MKSLFLATLSLVIGVQAFAMDRTVQAKYDSSVREVQLTIEDAQESGRACDYHVTSMKYDKTRRVLALTLGEEACFIELFAKKKAYFAWNLPRSLHNNSMCLRVDGRNLARVSFNADAVTVTGPCN